MPSRQLRQPSQSVAYLHLQTRPPFDFAGILNWLSPRLIHGVECIEDDHYLRVLDSTPGQLSSWLRVGLDKKESAALAVELHHVDRADHPRLQGRLRSMFDLDADPSAMLAALGDDPRLGPLAKRNPGLRIPGAWSGYECAIRAIIGQQISVKGANTIAARLVARTAEPLKESPHPGLTHRFACPRALGVANLDGIGLTGARIKSVRAICEALQKKELSFELGGSIDTWMQGWLALPGVGPWTASYLALRGLGHPDIFPHGDLVLRKVLSEDPEKPLTGPQARAKAEAWRPWRSYAAFLLWKSASDSF